MKVDSLPFFNKVENIQHSLLQDEDSNDSPINLRRISSVSTIKIDGAIEKLGKGASIFWFSSFANEKSIEWNLFKEKYFLFILC